MVAGFISKVVPPETLETPALWFIFSNGELLLQKNEVALSIPELLDLAEFNAAILFEQYLGIWQQKHCFCVEISREIALPEHFIWQPLRQAALQFLDSDYFHLASKALQILQWDKTHQFCSQCGKPLTLSPHERAKMCETCHVPYYPRIAPCIIVLIKRGKDILLARSPHFTPGVYSTLAGFVEPGESAEAAIAREVMEEVGIKIKNIQYRFSQSWPFPHSLMLGFTAEYAAGEIVIDGVEIEDAGWFTYDNLPPLPSPISISRRLIDLFVHKEF
jgi:NAD+ diphosphatase